ncbi:MAG TPA: ABC transporter permease [Gaiellaceae bacterium]|nr:ABC transporter permease [Gaiellaceae bacterium]
MSPLPAGAWRLVLKRAAHDRLVVAAAFLTILLAVTLLASGPVYAEAVALSGLRRTLEDAPVREVTVAVSGRLAAAERSRADEHVTRVLEDVFGADGVTVYRSALTDSYALPDAEGVPKAALTVFGSYEGLPGHARLVAGSWPAGGLGPGGVEAALPEPAARSLGLDAGESVELVPAQGDDEAVTVRVSGVYRVNDVDDPFWWGSPLETEGREELRFTTFGPLVVSDDAFGALATEGADIRWRAAPASEAIAVDDLDRLRVAVDELEERLQLDDGPSLAVQTGLEGVLARADRSLLVSRAGVLVSSVQLAVLAGAALLFLAGLLAERRGVESAILRSRGASAGEVGLLALAEGALLAVPAVVAGPWLAALSLQALNHVGPLAEIGLELEPRVGLLSYVLALVAGALCAAGLAAPALRSAAVAATVREQGRPAERGIVRRAGLDLVLVALAALGYWQLRRYQGPVVESLRGRLGIDPLLVVAPALGLLAGALLALRVVPALAALAERLAAGARGLVAPLGTRQLARRPGRYARAAVLVTLALAIGLFAAAYGSTWLRSQEDRAAYEAGADARVVPDERTGSIRSLHLATAYARLDGVEAALPVVQRPVDVPESAEPANLLALDASRAAEVVDIRPDLAERPLSELFAPLASERPELAAVELPGEPRRLAIAVGLTVYPSSDDPPGFPDELLVADVGLSLSLVLRDADGLLHRLSGGELTSNRSNRATREVVFELEDRLADGSAGRPGFPLALVALELRVNAGFGISRRATLVLGRLTADGAPVEAPDAVWTVVPGELQDALSPPEVESVRPGPDTLFALDFATGARVGACPPFCSAAPVTFTATPGRSEPLEAIPALVTDRFLEDTGTEVGATVALGAEGPGLRIAGSVRDFPTLPPDSGGVVVDLAAYSSVLYLGAGEVAAPAEWLVDAAPGRERAVARTLRAAPYSSAEVADRAGLAERLTHDPVALGISGALSLGFVAAAVFAVVGFAVSAAVSTAERTTEFAVLRSLGLSDRQLSAWLAVEGGITAFLALAGGIALGALVAWLVLPFVSLAGEGGRPFPEVVVELPWQAVAVLTGSLLAALAVVLAVQIVFLRRLALAPALRAGETR